MDMSLQRDIRIWNVNRIMWNWELWRTITTLFHF